MAETLREAMLRCVHQSDDAPDVVEKILVLPIFREVVEALEPFADDYNEAWSVQENGGHDFPDSQPIEGGSTGLTVGDLRRAVGALSKLRGEDHGQ